MLLFNLDLVFRKLFLRSSWMGDGFYKSLLKLVYSKINLETALDWGWYL